MESRAIFNGCGHDPLVKRIPLLCWTNLIENPYLVRLALRPT